MLSINEMLVSTIDKYLNDKRYAKVLTEVYNDFSLRKDFDFQSDKLTIYTILRGLRFLKELIMLQLILNKKIYIPGMGLFVISPNRYCKEYTFPETLIEMGNMGRMVRDTETLVHDNLIKKIIINNKLDFQKFNDITIQVRTGEKFTFYSKLETKIKYLNSKIKAFLKIKTLQITLKDNYSNGNKFSDIIEDYRNNPEHSIENYLKDIQLNDIAYNIKILEDIIVLIGYIEHNREKFDLV